VISALCFAAAISAASFRSDFGAAFFRGGDFGAAFSAATVSRPRRLALAQRTTISGWI
jgi:hypothetical protein